MSFNSLHLPHKEHQLENPDEAPGLHFGTPFHKHKQQQGGDSVNSAHLSAVSPTLEALRKRKDHPLAADLEARPLKLQETFGPDPNPPQPLQPDDKNKSTLSSSVVIESEDSDFSEASDEESSASDRRSLRGSEDPQQDPSRRVFTDLDDVMKRATLEDLLGPRRDRQRITILYHTNTVRDALKKLAARHVLSAPVLLNISLEDNDYGNYLGILGVGEILQHLIQDLHKNGFHNKNEGDKARHLTEACKEFMDTKVNIVVGNDVDMFHQAHMGLNLRECIVNGFLRNTTVRYRIEPPDSSSSSSPSLSTHSRVTRIVNESAKYVHRLAVFNPRGRVIHIISQSDVIRLIATRTRSLGDLGRRTVEELGFLKPDVVVVNRNESVARAFHTMYEKGVTSVGLVDQGGSLVGNLSASDLRGLTEDEFSKINEEVLVFIEGRRKKAAHEHKPHHPLVTVSPSDTFDKVVKLLSQTGLHRLYVVSKDMKPLGVITLTDVLQTIVSPPPFHTVHEHVAPSDVLPRVQTP